jgi:predicted metal-dependent hydrolase
MHPLLKFTADLFESIRPLTPIDKAPPAVALTTAPPVGAAFRHPRANREALLAGALVAFEFKRGKRRTIGFSVSPLGLAVRAPSWVPLHQVDAALQEKSRWIIQKLGESAARHQRVAAHDIEWRDGTTLPYLGQTLTVRLDPACIKSPRGVAAAVLLPAVGGTDDGGLLVVRPLTLRVSLPATAPPDQLRAAVQAWLMHQVKQYFVERLNHFAPQLQVTWRSVSLSSAKTRWGSARIDGAIRLNWRLVHFGPSVIDYVVAHELSHLREMNHSPRFWDAVRSVVPDYASLRQQLKDESAPRWA